MPPHPDTPRNRNAKPTTPLIWLVLALVLPVLLAPAATASPGDFFVTQPDLDTNTLRVGDTLRVCLGPSNSFDASPTFKVALDVGGNQTISPGPDFDPGYTIWADDEDCATIQTCKDEALAAGDCTSVVTNVRRVHDDSWDHFDPCWCLNKSGHYAVTYLAGSVAGGEQVYLNFTVTDQVLSTAGDTGGGGGTTDTFTITGFETFDQRTTELLWLVLLIISVTGTFWFFPAFVSLIMIIEQFADLPGIDNTWGFMLISFALVLELLTRNSPTMQRIRAAFSSNSQPQEA